MESIYLWIYSFRRSFHFCNLSTVIVWITTTSDMDKIESISSKIITVILRLCIFFYFIFDDASTKHQCVYTKKIQTCVLLTTSKHIENEISDFGVHFLH